MPLQNQSSVGAIAVTSSVLNQREDVTTTVDTEGTALFVDQLPNLVFWVRQIAGATPAEVTPEFAVRSITGAGTEPELEFLSLGPTTVLPANDVPLLLTFSVPANFIRLKIKVTGATHTIETYLAAFSP